MKKYKSGDVAGTLPAELPHFQVKQRRHDGQQRYDKDIYQRTQLLVDLMTHRTICQMNSSRGFLDRGKAADQRAERHGYQKLQQRNYDDCAP